MRIPEKSASSFKFLWVKYFKPAKLYNNKLNSSPVKHIMVYHLLLL
jgi:hypothetical protein